MPSPSNPDSPLPAARPRKTWRNAPWLLLTFLFTAAFVLSGSVNLGFSGPWLSLPFVVAMVFSGLIGRWNLAMVAVLTAAVALFLAQTWYPSLYFRHLGDELVVAEPACIMTNSARAPSFLMANCSPPRAFPSSQIGTLPAGRYAIVDVHIDHPDFGLTVDYVIQTSQGRLLASPGLVELEHADGSAVETDDAARDWWQKASILMAWPLVPLLALAKAF